MLSVLIIIHVFVCILLVGIVLLQFGKGAEAGAMMGQGSSQAVFTSSQKGNLFTKITTVLAILFMANSITISSLTSKKAKTSIFDSEAPVAKPLSSKPLNKKAEPAPKKSKK